MFSSPLQRAIARGLKPGGDLAEELRRLDDYTVRSRKDGKAICQALGQLPLECSDSRHRLASPLYRLAALFQKVDGPDAEAFDVLSDEGIEQLIRHFDARFERAKDDDADDLLFLLKIFVMYGSHEGVERLILAARRPLKPDSYLWHVIFSILSDGHPHREDVFEALGDPLPPGFLAVALLDSANHAWIEDGLLQRHPFDSETGCARLRDWLEDADPENFSYAHSATAALPFVSNPPRDALLALAMDHTAASVQIEAAWAAGRLGREAGLKVLARFCLDVNHSDVARRYLADLDREDLVPPETEDPAFRAKADFARWLAHPNELGRPPDELEIVDHRFLSWPPEREPKPFWLIRYRLGDRTGLKGDDVDCGLVGSITWCFFFYDMHQRPPEDAYAIHCYWEMEHAGLIAEAEVTDASEHARMVGQWRGEPLEEPCVMRVAELSPKLGCPARLVALASARLDDEEGWVVLDGRQSSWYPKAEQPPESHEAAPLQIHVGRQLLGFSEPPDRKKYLGVDETSRAPEQIVAAYDKLIDEAATAEPKQQKKLLGSFGDLSQHFEKYVDALAAAGEADAAETHARVYERFLRLAEQADPSIHDAVYDAHGVLGDQFPAYVDTMVSQDRSAEVGRLIELFSPYWDHNFGYGRLGDAAFKARLWDRAEVFLLQLRERMEKSHRSAGMSSLAEIWHDRGELEQARALLVDCLRKMATEIAESKYNSDREMFLEEFSHHRATYLRLFPDGESELAALGLYDRPS